MAEGTLSDAISEITTSEILDAFEIPQKRVKNKIYILCPDKDHEDTHFGSCYVDRNDDGYYCYVCGKHVGKWDMVVSLTGSKSTAKDWFFKASGLTPARNLSYDPMIKITNFIKQVSMRMQNNPIYQDVFPCEKKESSYGRSINSEYLFSEISSPNPLLELYKTDRRAFKTIIKSYFNGQKHLVESLQFDESSNFSQKEFDDVKKRLSSDCDDILNNVKNL